MPVEFKPSQEEAFGALVVGLDLSGAVSAADLETLRQALPKYRTLRFAEQALQPEDFVRFSQIFGRPQPHVLEHLRLPGHPEILVLTNIVEDRSKPNGHNGAAFWHTDNSYEAEPASATMLYAREVPKTGGETLLCDMGLAYRGLPDPLRLRCDSLVVCHRYGNRDQDKEHAAGALQSNQLQKVSEVTHPLVQIHPVTGERCLYAVAASSRGIVGMPDDEALDLLSELKVHCTKPDYTVTHAYTVDELFIWDTILTMHAAAVIDEARDTDNTRLMHRISVKGYPSLASNGTGEAPGNSPA